MDLHVSDNESKGGDETYYLLDPQQATDLMYWSLEASSNFSLYRLQINQPMRRHHVYKGIGQQRDRHTFYPVRCTDHQIGPLVSRYLFCRSTEASSYHLPSEELLIAGHVYSSLRKHLLQGAFTHPNSPSQRAFIHTSPGIPHFILLLARHLLSFVHFTLQDGSLFTAIIFEAYVYLLRSEAEAHLLNSARRMSIMLYEADNCPLCSSKRSLFCKADIY